MQEAKRGLRGPSETTGRKEAAEARGHAAQLLGLAAEEAHSREHGAENGRGQTTAHDDTGCRRQHHARGDRIKDLAHDR